LGARTDGIAAEARRRTSAGPLVVTLLLALVAYAAIAADVVHAGAASDMDADVAAWVARAMPSWAEWLARPFTWLGGVIGVTIVVAMVSYSLVRRGYAADAALLIVVALGMQVLVQTAKAGYERPRPTDGSAIDLPTTFSFPSGHAATGMAVFGLLGLLAATHAETRRARVAAIAIGFGVGAAIGASRVVLNVHYVTDVLAGACFGIAWLALCVLVARWLRERRARQRST
jgi:undecaprenyl-diphosphatase